MPARSNGRWHGLGVRKVPAGEPAEPQAGTDLELECRYEALRADVLGGAGQGWRWGRALLQRQGMAAWIRAWTDLPAPVPVPVPAAVSPSRPVTVVTPQAEQLVAVLAAMTLAVTTGGIRG